MSSSTKLNTLISPRPSDKPNEANQPEFSYIDNPLARRAVKAAHSFLSQAQQCSKTDTMRH
jgi:hypothetical protein